MPTDYENLAIELGKLGFYSFWWLDRNDHWCMLMSTNHHWLDSARYRLWHSGIGYWRVSLNEQESGHA